MDAKRPDRIPVLVISGFLGAGKTTFLNALLSEASLQDSLVLVNEFGDAGLDSLFLEEEAQATGSGLLVEELTSGCLCCTLQGPLVTTLEDLLRARDNDRIAPFKQLIIETTGLADPAPILAAFAKHPYLALRYLVGGIITLVDAAQDRQQLDETPEAVAQIAVADRLVMTKTDLVDTQTSITLATHLRARNPHAPIDSAPDLLADTRWIATLLAQASPFADLDDDGHGDHKHDHTNHHHDEHHHQHAYSVVLTADVPLEQRVVTMFMDLVGMNLPGDVLRIKGLVWLATKRAEAPSGPHSERHSEPWAIHAAGPLQHPARPIDPAIAKSLSQNQSQIVVITRTDQRAKLQELFKACLKQNRA